jgi:hypothetical protein
MVWVVKLEQVLVGKVVSRRKIMVLERPERLQSLEDLGQNYFDERDREGVKWRAIRRLEHLGFQVTLAPPPPALT